MKAENKEMSQALSSKETSICSIQQQLEEKTLECSVLSRQLQQTLDDAQRQVCNYTSTSTCFIPATVGFFTSMLLLSCQSSLSLK